MTQVANGVPFESALSAHLKYILTKSNDSQNLNVHASFQKELMKVQIHRYMVKGWRSVSFQFYQEMRKVMHKTTDSFLNGFLQDYQK